MIIAEIGVDMRRFAKDGGAPAIMGLTLCPQLNESAGKVLCRAACATAPRGSKPCWCNARGPRPATRTTISTRNLSGCAHGAVRQKAIIAVAASILTTVYHLLRDQVSYRDLGSLYFARMDRERTAQRLARRIKELGYEVEIRKDA